MLLVSNIKIKLGILKKSIFLGIIIILFGTCINTTNVISEDIWIKLKPNADFTYSPKNPIIFQPIKFIDNSTDSQSQIVSWWWDFNNGYYSEMKNPIFFYDVAGTYNVSLTVTNETGFSDSIQKAVKVFDDNVPPFVEIIQPKPWSIQFTFLYFIIKITKIPIFINGRFYVIVNATDNVGIESVEFYVDGEYKDKDYEPPYIWLWDEQAMLFLYELKVVARDYAGNEASAMIKVLRVQTHPPG